MTVIRKMAASSLGIIPLLALNLVACQSLNSKTSTETSPPQANLVQMNQGNMSGMDHGTMSGMNHGMDLGPADADYDLRFLDAMVPHHEGAIVMAQEVLQNSKRPEMKKLATDIIKAQTKEIATMQQWRTAWYPKAASTPMAWHAAMGHMMAMSDDQRQSMMMSMDLGKADAQFDRRFLEAMIPHHEGAIAMAKDALNKAKSPELKQLATNIITSQQAEIDQMKQWKKAWYDK